MIVCDCCKKPVAPEHTRMAVSWSEEMKDMGYGTPVIGKEASYDLCDECRKSLLNCMDKGPIWEYVQRCDKEHAELVTERNGLRAALDEVAARYKQLKESNTKLQEENKRLKEGKK